MNLQVGDYVRMGQETAEVLEISTEVPAIPEPPRDWSDANGPFVRILWRGCEFWTRQALCRKVENADCVGG